MADEMEKTWDPSIVEARIYGQWEAGGGFSPLDANKGKPHFSIAMPPPNITGQLHLGHALDATLPDAMVRYRRMCGDDAVWFPGSDHASIATEVKIIEKLAQEGKTKQDLGRDGFMQEAWNWREEYGRRIVQQQRTLGISCDWTRERFTMDEGLSSAVLEVFVRLYNEGLIYRGNRIIHWCPACKTALSDAEVEYEEQQGHLWYITYPAEDGGQGVVVATTRPETMLGDTGVAVNPKDARYAHLVGKNVRLPLRERMIPVVADDYVDKDFGTGAVKMTPAHDPNDFEVGLRHNLAVDRIMNDDGTLTDACGKYAGMTMLQGRKEVLKDLEAQGLLIKVEDLAHNVGSCYRCHHTVEPLVSLQWFVKMEPLAKPAIAAVADKSIQVEPERFEKIYMNWMGNIRDWCISRQLWWGHRIPAYYCDTCGALMVAKEQPDTCKDCGGTRFHQDEDVLDTWFSSALWPFSIMGWPEKTQDLERFFPTTLMYMGSDILFFWGARMIMMSLHLLKQKPFEKLLFHGMVRDEQGRKMSKSLGNGLDPIELVEKYGADATRLALLMGVAQGNDIRFKGEERMEAARNFANKVWNAARFAIMNLDGPSDPSAPKSLADRWILHRTGVVCAQISAYMDAYETDHATQRLYDFIWNELCDWYLELAKTALYGEDESAGAAARDTLMRVLDAVMKMLHPFMPFLTEEIYANLPSAQGLLMMQTWPNAQDFPCDEEAAQSMEQIMGVIRAVRTVRADMNVPPSRKARLLLRAGEGCVDLMVGAAYFEKLAGASSVELLTGEPPKGAASAVTAYAQAFMPMNELIDIDKERARLSKEMEAAKGEVQRLSGKLGNEGFTAKAPASVVEGEKQKLDAAQGLLATLVERLKALDTL